MKIRLHIIEPGNMGPNRFVRSVEYDRERMDLRPQDKLVVEHVRYVVKDVTHNWDTDVVIVEVFPLDGTR